MSNFAHVVDGLVVNISTASDDWSEAGWIVYRADNPAFIGGPLIDGWFYPPRPYLSWQPVEGAWVPPVPVPDNVPFKWTWDEETFAWVEVSLPE